MALVRIASLLCLLAGLSLQIDAKSGKNPQVQPGIWVEDVQRMPQYVKKPRHWDRFRDVSYDVPFTRCSIEIVPAFAAGSPLVYVWMRRRCWRFAEKQEQGCSKWGPGAYLAQFPGQFGP
ncbi:hypothetical protein WMY93_010352 [Mugilogobius chulae]|uniref:Uncharacterized protein n=1 Tax=Mugilogobius chulae TaxID=88201 RepID=A0AAW0PJM8_9GOBI